MKNKRSKIWHILISLGYFVVAFVIIFESCLNGQASTDHSDTVGGALADIVNDIGGDQTTAIMPTSLTIKNKIEEAKVGDVYQLETETLPTNATYKAINYSSSNDSVALISSLGQIEFLKAGQVTISVTNDKKTDLKDSMTINVSNVEVEDISCAINANIKEGNYHLYLDEDVSYYVTSEVIPSNATNAKVEYEVSTNEYLSIDENGKITPLNYSYSDVTTIKVKAGNIEKELHVLVDANSVKRLTSISASNDNIVIGQSKQAAIKFNPSDATYKDFELESDHPEIVSIVNKKSYKGLKEGTAIITARSLAYSLECTFSVQVNPIPELTSFSVDDIELVETRSKTIAIKNVQPAFADTSNVTFASSDNSVASVNEKGIVTANKEGETDVTVTINGISRTLKVKVLSCSDPINELTFNYDFTKTYKIEDKTTIDIKSIIGNPNEQLNHPELVFTSSNANVASIDENDPSLLNIKSSGMVNISIYHPSSGLTYKSPLKLLIVFPYEVRIDSQQVDLSSPLYLNVNETKTLSIVEEGENKNASYKVASSSDSQIKKNLSISKKSNTEYELKALSKGECSISVGVLINGQVYEEKTLKVNTAHIYANTLKVEAIDLMTNQEVEIKDHTIFMYINETIKLNSVLEGNYTTSELTYTSSDENILMVTKEGKLQPKGIGTVQIMIADNAPIKDDEEVKAQEILTINVSNLIMLDQTKPFTIQGPTLEYNQEKDEYTIVNGNSAKVSLNFSSNTTFKKTTYLSSDDKIIKVHQDGTITPLKAGSATITVSCDDGASASVAISFTIKVKPQRAITDLKTFLHKVRKNIGHFGAFFVLGTFSTFFYMMTFSKKRWGLAVGINIFQGVGIAFLTEFIQTIVPGRYGALSDVLLDSFGFLLSAVVLTIAIICFHVIKQKKKQDIKDEK